MNSIRRLLRIIPSLRKQRVAIKEQSVYSVQFYNCWDQPNDEMYWNQFITSRRLLPEGKTVAFFSAFGDRRIIDKVHADAKVFYSAENLKRDCFSQYADHGLGNPSIDLAMGFEVFEHPRYIRFPLWMDYMFPADSPEEAIRAKCRQLRFPDIEGKDKFCCMIASNRGDGLREEMFEKISRVAKVDSAGRYLHNDDSLQTDFGDNKKAYIQQYAFNICPENTSAYGYTTEKLFEAISMGCIPIYWGGQFADYQVINEDAVIRWDREYNGQQALKALSELYYNPHLLRDFLSQPRLLPTAEEYIQDTYSAIEHRLRALLNSR